MHLFTTAKIRKHYRYRSARGIGMLIEMHYDRDDVIHRFEKDLCREAKVDEDNHHGFLIESRDGQTLFLWFTDWRRVICGGVEEKPW